MDKKIIKAPLDHLEQNAQDLTGVFFWAEFGRRATWKLGHWHWMGEPVLAASKGLFFIGVSPGIHGMRWKVSLSFREELVTRILSEDMAESIPLLKCLRNIRGPVTLKGRC